MTAITSAGAGSGIDLESVISASVAAKKSQLQQPITTQQTNTQITLSGVGQLKSAISTFTTALDTLSATGAFNKRSVNITQSTDNPVLQVETKTDTANGQYNITVNQLAATSRLESSFASSTTSLVNKDGTLTFKAGTKSFSVDVKAGDTLQNIRSKINSSGDNFGLSANIVNASDGTAKLVIDSGISGSGNDLSITSSGGDGTDLSVFNYTPGSTPTIKSSGSSTVGGGMIQTQLAASAKIDVDGNTVTSDTNVFDDKIQGLKITALRTSDKDTNGNLTSNKVAVTTDTSSIQTMVQKFIDGYNSFFSQTTALGKRNTIVSGVSQNDGGSLAGDSMPRAVRNLATNTILAQSTQSSVFSTIFELGVSMDNSGKLSLNSDKFKTALDKNFDQVVALFGGSNGIAASISGALKDYTKTGGLISIRQDSLNTTLRTLSDKQTNVTDQLTKYETTLRQQYGNLDSLLANMKKSASYLTALTKTSSTSSSG